MHSAPRVRPCKPATALKKDVITTAGDRVINDCVILCLILPPPASNVHCQRVDLDTISDKKTCQTLCES